MTTNPTWITALVSLAAPASFAAEQYQGLRLKIERLRRRAASVCIAVTSPGVSDGKTVTSINLAGALARGSGARVLLIDADLRRSSVGAQLGLEAGMRRASPISSREPGKPLAGTDRAVRRSARLRLLPAGSSAMSVQRCFARIGSQRSWQEARGLYDYVAARHAAAGAGVRRRRPGARRRRRDRGRRRRQHAAAAARRGARPARPGEGHRASCSTTTTARSSATTPAPISRYSSPSERRADFTSIPLSHVRSHDAARVVAAGGAGHGNRNGRPAWHRRHRQHRRLRAP